MVIAVLREVFLAGEEVREVRAEVGEDDHHDDAASVDSCGAITDNLHLFPPLTTRHTFNCKSKIQCRTKSKMIYFLPSACSTPDASVYRGCGSATSCTFDCKCLDRASC